MGYLDSLPTLSEMERQRRALPKHQMTSRLEEKTEKRKSDAKAEETWKKAVRKRDGMKCRWCRREVVVTMALVPERAECHHAIARAHRVTRHDVRNGILVCKSCHDVLTGALGGDKALIVPSRFYNIDGVQYPDMGSAVEFRKVV